MIFKETLLIGLLLRISILGAVGQQNRPNVIIFIAPVPLVIESELLVDYLTNNRVLHAVSGKLKVALAPRINLVISDINVFAGKPIPAPIKIPIEYRSILNGNIFSKWVPLKLNQSERNGFPYAGKLLDTTLSETDSIVIQFRIKATDSLLQQIVLTRPQFIPIISRYREKNNNDSIANRIQSKSVTNKKEKWFGFESVEQNNLVVSPGKHIELLFKNHSITKDSCIWFRLYKDGDSSMAIWKRTGHLLSLADLETKEKYQLDVKYEGMSASNTYALLIKPFWYETSIAIVMFSVLSLAALLGIPYILYSYIVFLKTRNRTQLKEQLKSVQSQLNPHFIYNALNSIESLVTHNENERANEYLSSFAEIMRETLRNSNVLFTSLAEEITMLGKYIRIEQLRFEFKYILEIDPSLNLEEIEFPPMLLQPSIENAVKHGVSGLGYRGMIRLCFKKINNNLVITIEDNGKGIGDPKPAGIQKGNGVGIAFTRERIDKLKKLYKKEEMDFRIFHGERGTIVTFHFKNWIES